MENAISVSRFWKSAAEKVRILQLDSSSEVVIKFLQLIRTGFEKKICCIKVNDSAKNILTETHQDVINVIDNSISSRYRPPNDRQRSQFQFCLNLLVI